MITVYGIRNCDTCRKALKWLEAEGVEHRFHDVRADGLDRPTLAGWVKAVGWETLLNRRGTTWRNLSDAERGGLTPESATELMLQHPTLIKRPVFATGGDALVGFSRAEMTALKSAA
jgi:Spx/MgsR family transcriptional regulator